MTDSSIRSTDRQSGTDSSTEHVEHDLIFEGETLRISPQYLRRFLAWLAERRD